MSKIGILDSGVGGLSIWKEISKELPQVSTVYIADSLNCPYGSKTRGEIYQLTKKLISFLLKKNVDIIVLACNTITVSCIDDLRKEYPNIPIVGTVPVIKTAIKLSKNKKIGILSTEITAKSEYQKQLIAKFSGGAGVINIGTNLLVPMIENGDLDEHLDKVLKEVLEPFKEADIDVLVLGCSHFPLIKDRIQRVLPGVLIIDSAEAIARQVKRILPSQTSKEPLKREFYNSKSTTFKLFDDYNRSAHVSLRDIITFKLL